MFIVQENSKAFFSDLSTIDRIKPGTRLDESLEFAIQTEELSEFLKELISQNFRFIIEGDDDVVFITLPQTVLQYSPPI